MWLFFLVVYSQAGENPHHSLVCQTEFPLVREPLERLDPVHASLDGWEYVLYVMALAFVCEGIFVVLLVSYISLFSTPRFTQGETMPWPVYHTCQIPSRSGTNYSGLHLIAHSDSGALLHSLPMHCSLRPFLCACLDYLLPVHKQSTIVSKASKF